MIKTAGFHKSAVFSFYLLPFSTSSSEGGYGLFSEWSVAHATRRADGREECCERGYYDLHRQLDDPLLLHIRKFSFASE